MTPQVIEKISTQNSAGGIFSSLFKSVTSWYIPTSRENAETAEFNILTAAHLRINNDPLISESNSFPKEKDNTVTPTVDAVLGNVYIDENNYIRTLLIENNKSNNSDQLLKGTSKDSQAIVSNTQNKNTLVITHGYATALGFYFKNYKDISQIPNIKVCAIDWLGMGLSSRLDFKIDKKLDINKQIETAEEYFVESLEKWRQKMQIEKMTLLGHSFGGYMSSLYALKYPERVDKLILESPVGVQKTPEYLEDFLQTGDFDKLKEISISQIQKSNDYNYEKYAMLQNRIKNIQMPYTILVSSLIKSWNNYGSPQSLLRYIGRFGPNLVDRYIGAFRHLSSDDKNVLSNYMYHISVQKASSERALGVILKPLAFARKPLFDRIDKLKVPTIFMYGENDWMDARAGEQVASKIQAQTKVYTISKAGHNMHLDNPPEFNKIIEEIMSTDKQ
ncbi:hypothetical protein BB561_006250 [Smittium simulii]|uniref:AB hydrolase-1 domain-containing protein n=1 Tax=Smittium simulii TaxID=133385 RepID=A0A2T9Y5P4_9FUNG|nr:hypothetical protein BB561_006250 [Smittium simulii]